VEFLIFVLMIASGYGFGRLIEQRHLKSIRLRERASKRLPILNRKSLAEDVSYAEAQLFAGSVVVSIDYFKRISAALRGIVGGRVHAYESLLDRGRREAILRMKEQAMKWGAKEIVNLRLETSTIGGSANQERGLGSVEVVAYATGLK